MGVSTTAAAIMGSNSRYELDVNESINFDGVGFSTGAYMQSLSSTDITCDGALALNSPLNDTGSARRRTPAR